MESVTGIPISVVLLASSLIGLFIVGRIIQFNRLRTFKGPFLTHFTNLPHRKALFKERCHEWYAEVCETYGATTHFSGSNPPAANRPLLISFCVLSKLQAR
jgi:hypothetical protein